MRDLGVYFIEDWIVLFNADIFCKGKNVFDPEFLSDWY